MEFVMYLGCALVFLRESTWLDMSRTMVAFWVGSASRPVLCIRV